MSFIDLQQATQRMSDLVRKVTPEQLDDPTPCTDYTVGDLLDHIAGFAQAFTNAARKSALDVPGPPPLGDRSHLDPGWQQRMPEQLDELAQAWREPGANLGMTKAGGIEMPAEIAAVVALEELVVHGWDLARATGRPFTADDAALESVSGFFSQFAGPDQTDVRGTAYAAPVTVGAGASPLERAIALAGRDPGWKPDA